MLSPITLAVTNTIHKADLSSDNLKADVNYRNKIITWVDYLHACREMISQKPFLTEELLQKRLHFIEQDTHLPENFPSGYRCCITVIPCSNGGFPFTHEDLERGRHLLILIIDDQDMVIDGFSMQPSPLYQLLPLEIQEQLTFVIPEYSLENNGVNLSVPLNVRQQIMDEFSRVFKKAQEMFVI